MLHGDRDTIAAIATAKGVGALGIVRTSGSQSRVILEKCLLNFPKNLESHRSYHGVWLSPGSKTPIDDVLILYFAEGKGFTGEESIEITCHGGIEVTNLVLNSCLESGARLAAPGEFTYRAFMNGKMDLLQAESVLGLIQARSARAAAISLHQLRGKLSQIILKLESEVVYLLAHLEAAIDFTTEDIQPVEYSVMLERTQKLILQTKNLLESYLPSCIANRGIRAVLVGCPNAGKSSLLNALLGTDRSIVHESPGTTRDTVEAEITKNGLIFRFVDTAGLRHSLDPVENFGVARSREEQKIADIVVYVVDSVNGLSNEDVKNINEIESARCLICFNKKDLKDRSPVAELQRFSLSDYDFCSSSAVGFDGTGELLQKLCVIGSKKTLGSEVDSALSTQRQFELVQNIYSKLSEASAQLLQNISPDLISFSFREALSFIQQILGKNVGDEIMDLVFKEFCIGK